MFIDTHCHFDAPPFVDDSLTAVNKFRQAHVAKIIVPSVSVKNFEIVKLLSERYQPIYYALGLHPIYPHQPEDLVLLNQILANQHPKLVAIGETGLDNYLPNANMEQQQHFLLCQFELAKQYRLPMILHSRKTHPQLLALLKQAKLPNVGVIHGFSGSYEQAMQFIRLGFYIGVGGIISYERAKKTRSTMSKIPLEFIVLETDAPDMPLSGRQGQPNRPEYLVNVFDMLVSLRHESAEQIQHTILTNTLTLFPRINTMN